MAWMSKNLFLLALVAAFVAVSGYGLQLVLTELARCHGELLALSTRAAGF